MTSFKIGKTEINKFTINIIFISIIGLSVSVLFVIAVCKALANSSNRQSVIQKLHDDHSFWPKDWTAGYEGALINLSAHSLYQDLGVILILAILVGIIIWGIAKVCQSEYTD